MWNTTCTVWAERRSFIIKPDGIYSYHCALVFPYSLPHFCEARQVGTVVTALTAERPTNPLMIYCLPRSITGPAEHSEFSQALVLRPSCVPEKSCVNKK